jgi:hypothetical protein
MPLRLATRSLFFPFSRDFFRRDLFRRRASQPAKILAGQRWLQSSVEKRSPLLQFALARRNAAPAGLKTQADRSYTCVRFVINIQLSATDGGRSRPTTRSTTGFGSGAAAAQSAKRLSPSYPYFPYPTPITAFWRASRHCYCAYAGAARGTRQFPPSKTRIVSPTPPRCASGERMWTRHSWSNPSPSKRLSESPRGWKLLLSIRAKRCSYPG